MIAANEQVQSESAADMAREPITKLDLVSIEAMICYTANRVKADESFIKHAVLSHFKISNLKKLPRAKTDIVIKYLANYRVPANSR